MYQTNQSKSIQKEIINLHMEMFLKMITLFKTARTTDSSSTYLYETQLKEYATNLKKLNSDFVNKAFLKGRGFEAIESLRSGLKLCEELSQACVYSDKFVNLLQFVGLSPETANFCTELDEPVFSQNSYVTSQTTPSLIYELQEVQNQEIICPFYPIKSEDVLNLEERGVKQAPFFVRFTTDTDLSVLKTGLKNALFRMIGSNEKKNKKSWGPRSRFLKKKDNLENRTKRKLKFRIHFLKNSSTFQTFYKDILKARARLAVKEKAKTDDIKKMKIDSWVLFENNNSIQNQVSQDINFGSVFIVEYTTRVDRNLLFSGNKYHNSTNNP